MTTQPPLTERSVHEQLRLELLSGAYAPGERLRIAALCDRYGVSLSVVREALTRLAEQGLARAERNRGFAAIRLSLAGLEDLTGARVLIEQAALRPSIARGDMTWEGNVVSAHYRLTKTPIASFRDDQAQAQAWAEAHSAFHASLSAACASPRLLELRQQLFDASEIYRAWLSQKLAGVRDDRSEHQELMDAVLARDADLACDLATAHTMETLKHASVHEALAEESAHVKLPSRAGGSSEHPDPGPGRPGKGTSAAARETDAGRAGKSATSTAAKPRRSRAATAPKQ